jgi:hypothetical protein
VSATPKQSPRSEVISPSARSAATPLRTSPHGLATLMSVHGKTGLTSRNDEVVSEPGPELMAPNSAKRG